MNKDTRWKSIMLVIRISTMKCRSKNKNWQTTWRLIWKNSENTSKRRWARSDLKFSRNTRRLLDSGFLRNSKSFNCINLIIFINCLKFHHWELWHGEHDYLQLLSWWNQASCFYLPRRWTCWKESLRFKTIKISLSNFKLNLFH